jgi:anaerobic magnesium-protoporphyrin IX monomethyl ester cyclase
MKRINKVLFVMASAETVPGLSGKIAIPPAGMLSIAGYARQYFPETNFMLRDFGAECLAFEEQIQIIKKKSPDIIGMAARSFIYPATVKLATAIKEVLPKTKIIFGGHHPTLMPESTKYPSCFDVVVRYEGEKAFVELLKMYSNNEPLPGFYSSEYLDDLSHDYAWDLIEYPGAYARLYSPFNADPLGSAVWSRGCPFDCFFCSGPALWKGSFPRVRYRSPQSIINELKSMYSLGVRRFFIHDDTPNTNLKKFESILHAIINENPKMTWGAAGMRANKNMTPEYLFPLLYKAGCRYICFGIESGDPRVLEKLNRKVSLEEVERALLLTKKYGMRPAGGFSIGHIWLEKDGSIEGENEVNLEITIKYIKNLLKKRLLWSIQFSVIDPVPGSRLWDTAKKFNLLKIHDWEDLLKYDRVRLNFKHPHLTSDTVEFYYKKAYRIISINIKHAFYLISTIRSFRDFYGLIRTGFFVWKNRV